MQTPTLLGIDADLTLLANKRRDARRTDPLWWDVWRTNTNRLLDQRLQLTQQIADINKHGINVNA